MRPTPEITTAVGTLEFATTAVPMHGPTNDATSTAICQLLRKRQGSSTWPSGRNRL